MSNNISVWLIIPQTNLHVGNESVVNFGVIDKAIQRDVTTDLPCINSASLKGAIKEYLTGKALEEEGEEQGKKLEKIKALFGSVKVDKSGNTQKGNAVFFDAQLLFIPQQCIDGEEVYRLAYSDGFLDNFVQRAKSLGCNCDVAMIKGPLGKLASHSISVDDFKQICSDDALPIIARNCLDNGESVNLWYEQVLPSMSVLATLIKTQNETDLDELNGKIVQIGANATIGYGYCKFIKL